VGKENAMKKYVILVFITIILLVKIGFSFAENKKMMSLYNELAQPVFDTKMTGHIEDLTLYRDVATFYLKKGTIYFFKPIQIQGKSAVIGAIFSGEGSFSFTPPTKIEKEQLARFYKKETYSQEFNTLVLYFVDSTFAQISKHLSLHPNAVPPKIRDEWEYCQKYILEPRNENIFYYIMMNLPSDNRDGYFYAYIRKNNSDPVFFIYNPFQVEEVEFQKPLSKLNYVTETVSQFQKNEDYSNHMDYAYERKDIISIKNYRIVSKIEQSGDFSAKAVVTFDVIKDSLKAMKFFLAPKLIVDQVTSSSGTSLSFVKKDKSYELIIFPDHPLIKDEKSDIKIEYHGDVIERLYGDYYIKSSTLWYPRYGFRNRATYDLTFKTPEQYEFASIGEKTEDRIEDKYRITHWFMEKPVVNAGFNLGLFKNYDINVKGAPPITVLMSEIGHREIALYLLKNYDILSSKNMEKQIGADIANSIQIFSHLFGSYPYERIYVSEIPYPHGEAFPGFIHLHWLTFQTTSREGYSEIFRAHEVSHQWWGVTVGYKTYHDQWLSEGFADYSGLWYLQWETKDNKKFFHILDEWKNKILTNRKYLLGSGVEAGPIWLGYRTSSSETEGDYALIVYKKGAYVLHMLRNLLIDLRTMNEEKFTHMLQEYYATYKGKDASTEDFKQIVSKYCGENMDWFFDEWVYGTDIPTYEFSSFTSKKPEGNYLVHCRVVQKEVSEDFKMYVPITVQYKGDKFSRIRILIDKPVMEFDLPAPMKPEKIIFNDLHSVLAKVKYVKYETK